MKFKKDVLVELSEYDKGVSFNGFEILYTKQIDTSRWSIIYEQVFSFEDKFYITGFRRAATETQDEQPYDYEDDVNGMIEVKRVYPKEITVTVYVTKENL